MTIDSDNRKTEVDFDVIVVGAGIGGLYGVHRFHRQGLRVLGIEGGRDVGGVWLHNAYPGARVDVESIDYCYYFSPELYREWRWTERYAGQPELLRYLRHVADRFDLRRHFRFNERVVSAQWEPDQARYRVRTSTRQDVTCRFLVMATGQLSAPRKPPFAGLDDFKGEWAMTAQWPDRHMELNGKRIAVIGTGSSGVQVVTELAPLAGHLTVFQRSPNYSVPAWNAPADDSAWREIADDVENERQRLFYEIPGTHARFGKRPMADYSPEEQQAMIEAAWANGGHGMAYVFSDQGTDGKTNKRVADFVKAQIRAKVKNPETAELLCAFDHPIGTRRLVVDTGYYEAFNRDNVSLVSVRNNPIDRITRTGIRMADGTEHEVDVIIFALGFNAFRGAIEAADIRNAAGVHPTDRWAQGPRTLIGLMTAEFPNLFLPTGPGSPSVLGNFTLQNEFLMDWIGDCIAYMDAHGFDTIEATPEAEAEWSAHCAELSEKLMRRQVENYMVHTNPDGSRVFIPYAGGMDRYARHAADVAQRGYDGFRLRRRERAAPGEASDAASAAPTEMAK